MTSQTAGGLGAKAAELNPVKKVRSPARYARKESAASSRSQKQLAASALRLITAKPILGASRKTTEEMDKGKSLKKVAFGKKAKFVDGTGQSADEEDDHQILHQRRDASAPVQWTICQSSILPPQYDQRDRTACSTMASRISNLRHRWTASSLALEWHRQSTASCHRPL